MSECSGCQRLASDLTTLWDGRSYCGQCLREAGSALAVAAQERSILECTIKREDLSYGQCIRMFTKVFLVMVGIPFAIPIAVTLVRGDWINLQITLVLFLSITAFMWLFIGLGMRVRLYNCRRQLPRTITVAAGEVTIVTPHVTHRLPLASCDWVFSKAAHDEVVAMFL